MSKFVYAFEEGGKEQKYLLGGKGANLAEMTNLGLPVPPGFTISTEACNAYMAGDNAMPAGLMDEVAAARAALEQKMGKVLGAGSDPLLVSVRSGAPFSMPGMMDTVLNLGLNDESVQGLAQQTGNERFAYDSYRRFVQMFGKIVLDVPGDLFEEKLHELVEAKGVAVDTDLSAVDLEGLVADFKGIVRAEAGVDFPDDPTEQLRYAIEAVFKSWNGKRARDYRRYEGIADDLGTAVNVQAMVFGNKGDDSGTGVAFTRNPASGESLPYGDFLKNAEGEDVVAGIRITEPLAAMANEFPESHKELLGVMAQLENHYRDMCDIEFTIEQGRLFMLQTRVGKRTAAAALRMAVEMVSEGLIDEKEAVLRVAAGAARPAPAPTVRSQGRLHRAREGAQRLAGRGGRQGVLHGRRGRGAPPRGRARDPRAPRDVTRRPARHDRGGGHPHVTRRTRVARGRRRVGHGHARDLRCGRRGHRPRGEAVRRGRRHREGGRRHLDLGHVGRDRARRGGGDHARAHRPLRHDPRLGRSVPPPEGAHQRRPPRGREACPRVRRGGHRPVPHRAHVPRRPAAHRAAHDPRRQRGRRERRARRAARRSRSPTSSASSRRWTGCR